MEGYKNVPFGNSIFQIQHFTDGQETQERRYRHLLLQLHQKTNTLRECEFSRRRIEIDIAELTKNLSEGNYYDKQRTQVDIEEKEYNLDSQVKLIEDCLIEVATYKALLKDLPEFTRQQFEDAEQRYWEKRLVGDAKRQLLSHGTIAPDTLNSLSNIGIMVNRTEDGQVAFEHRATLTPLDQNRKKHWLADIYDMKEKKKTG